MEFLYRISLLHFLGFVFAPLAWAQSIIPPNLPTDLTPMLIDKNGKTVGRFAASGPGSYGAVILDVNRESVVLNLSYDLDSNGLLASNGLSWQAAGALFYTSAHCTGKPYVGFGNLSSRRPAAVLRQDKKWIAYIGQADNPNLIGTHSYLPPDGICVGMFSERRVVPVAYTLHLDTIGLPPFYIH